MKHYVNSRSGHEIKTLKEFDSECEAQNFIDSYSGSGDLYLSKRATKDYRKLVTKRGATRLWNLRK